MQPGSEFAEARRSLDYNECDSPNPLDHRAFQPEMPQWNVTLIDASAHRGRSGYSCAVIFVWQPERSDN